MTTVVATRNEMSCDLQFTYGGELKFKGRTKIIKLKPKVARAVFGVDGAVIGFAGEAESWGEIVSWYDEPTTELPKPKKLELLMLTSEKKIYHASTLKNWMEIDEPVFAIGSGMQWAMSAVVSGKTTAEAVRIAMKYDPNTGLGVKTYTP
jgi:hypothetical protein